ncbi:hypothetical protein [Nocardia thraciensis]
MTFTVYLADSSVVTYGRGYRFGIGPSGSLAITGNNRARYYAPGYWAQVDEHPHDTVPGDRRDTAPGTQGAGSDRVSRYKWWFRVQ